MTIGVVGLGRMGLAIASRLIAEGYIVFGYDPNKDSQENAAQAGVRIVDDLVLLPKHTRIIWIMVPAGKPVDDVLAILTINAQHDDIFIDGGNSNFNDSIRRAQDLAALNIHFLDCGTSGGLHGATLGFCLMVGGNNDVFKKVEPYLKAIASLQGYALVGPTGAGHYVKMVHNGIEYALLQAYAEGFALLKDGHFKNAQLDLAQISHLWNQSSIIRSWILHLAQNVFEQDQALESISGEIAESGMGLWTVQEAQEHLVEVPTIQKSLDVRAWSRKTGGNYATKIVAMLRNQFGGHAVNRKDE
jgi:6-phosphogluconate dehydrogenase